MTENPQPEQQKPKQDDSHNSLLHPPESSRAALRRLLVVLGVTLGVMIYSYGWTVTQIDLEKPQEEQRQQNVGRALRDLLSPRLFQQEIELSEVTAQFLMDCAAGDAPTANDADTDQPVLALSSNCGMEDDEITLRVRNSEPYAEARIRWLPPEGQERPIRTLETGREDITLDRNGSFEGRIEVPRIRDSDGQVHQVAVRAAVPAGPVQLSDISQTVILRMVETIFMALLATSIAIPIATMISFGAARNLMRPVRLKLGNMLVFFITFVFGLWLGGLLLGPIGEFALALGTGGVLDDIAFPLSSLSSWSSLSSLSGGDGGDDIGIAPLLAFVIPLLVVGVGVYLLRSLRQIGSDPAEKLKSGKAKAMQDVQPTPAEHARNFASALLIALLIVFGFGALGGLGLMGATQLDALGEGIRPESVAALDISGEEVVLLPPGIWLQNALADGLIALGVLLGTLSELTRLLMPFVGSLVLGTVLSGIAGTLTKGRMRNLPQPTNALLGGALGAVASAMLMGFMGALAQEAALFGLLAPLVAAVIGGQTLLVIYLQATNAASKPRGMTSRTERSLRSGLFVVGAALAFLATFQLLNVGRALVNGTLPPEQPVTLLGLEISLYVVVSALIGAILGGAGGAVAGVSTNFPLGSTVYNVMRTVLNTVRSIEPLIMGLVFVIWVGIGPFAGVLALTLHSIAALGKLYSEQVENIDDGPIEAIRSTGANWLQMVRWSVIPQIIPPYIAFTMYRWDINVRMSTIIGFVGGGGIGLLLQQQINLLRYRDAGVAVLAIAVVVSVLDYASASIRERIN
jgi:phosphonate ABC transporter permease subunit PhnE